MDTKLVVTLLVTLTLHTLHAYPVPDLTALGYQELKQLLREEVRLLASEQELEARLEDLEAKKDSLEDPDLYEGDIVLEQGDLVELQDWEVSEQGAVERSEKYRWPNGVVRYEFHESIRNDLKEYILNAIEEYEDKTCLKFREAVSGDRILFTKEGKGCSSKVGRRGGVQTVTLANCKSHRIVLHEIGHAIGFWHEQSRPDRDRYLEIIWNNIRKDKQHNFNLHRTVDYQDEAYNYGSIMHYHKSAFSIDRKIGSLEVINDKVYEQQGYPILGRAQHLSPIDVRQINKMYKCFNPHGQEGTLVVTMLRAHDLGRNYPTRACVRAFNSAGDNVYKCTEYSSKDHTNPVWDQELTFEPEGDSGWRYFEIYVIYKTPENRRFIRIGKQTIWVDGAHKESSYCVSANECVEYEYRVEEHF